MEDAQHFWVLLLEYCCCGRAVLAPPQFRESQNAGGLLPECSGMNKTHVLCVARRHSPRHCDSPTHRLRVAFEKGAHAIFGTRRIKGHAPNPPRISALGLGLHEVTKYDLGQPESDLEVKLTFHSKHHRR